MRLLLDNHGSHLTYEFIEFADEHRIILLHFLHTQHTFYSHLMAYHFKCINTIMARQLPMLQEMDMILLKGGNFLRNSQVSDKKPLLVKLSDLLLNHVVYILSILLLLLIY